MRTRRASRRPVLPACLLVCAIGLGLSAPPPVQAASFREIGVPGAGPLENLTARAVDATGDQIVGAADLAAPASGSTWFVYDEDRLLLVDGGPQLPPGYTGDAVGQQTTLDGLIRRTVGTASGTAQRVFVRTEDAGLGTDTTQLLPPHPTATASMRAAGIGRNGDVVGRWSNGIAQGAFRFDAASGSYTSALQTTYNAIDAAGDRHVGHEGAFGNEAARLWEASGEAIALGFLPGGSVSTALGVSASGRLVVGQSGSTAVGAGLREAFRWHPDLGMHPLEPIPPSESRESAALATSDANVVVGWYRSTPGETAAFLWTPAIGRVDLKAHLISQYGLLGELFGWTLTEARAISADGRIIVGRGTNPAGEKTAWVVDLDGPDPLELRLRPVSPDDSPSAWSLHLRCGDRPVSRLYFGLIEPPGIALDAFDFGGCNDPQGQNDLYCTGAPSIGPKVSESSFVSIPTGEDAGLRRGDTIYATLIGHPNHADLLCSPGDDEVFLADFQIDQPTPELALSGRDGVVAYDDLGNEIPLAEFRMIREPESPATVLTLRPALDDPGGTRFAISLAADRELARFSFGIILPPGASEFVFGDCWTVVGPYNQRACAGPTDLGSSIEYSKVVTIGPDPALANAGLRDDTMYVYLEGNLPGPELLPGINVAGRRHRLGFFEFGTSSLGFGFVPTITFHGVENLDLFWSAFSDWTDRDIGDLEGTVTYASYEYGGGTDPNSDGDTIEDADDLCPYVYSEGNQDDGTLEQPGYRAANSADHIGNECQCGDVSVATGQVVSVDIDALRDLLNDPTAASAIPYTELVKCNTIGPVYNVLDTTTGLPTDCSINDVFGLLRGRNGQPPLVGPAPGANPSCPDVMNP